MPGSLAGAAVAIAGLVIFTPGPAQQAEALGTRLVAPIELGVARAASTVGRFFQTVQQAGDLSAQNQRYREEVDRLQATLVQIREVELENHDLRQLLGLRARTSLGTLLPVNVIAQEPLPVLQSVTVDRGADDGVTVDLPVITWRGVVGRTVEVRPTSSKVLLLTDVNSAVSARIQDPESRATGTVRGTGDGRLLLQYVLRSDALRTGDIAITSGIGGVFPPGLVVGRVVQVRQKDVEAFQEALVEAAADMRNLERLFILTQR